MDGQTADDRVRQIERDGVRGAETETGRGKQRQRPKGAGRVQRETRDAVSDIDG
jgi:hypothetical protein